MTEDQIANALTVLTTNLREDPNYKLTWQCNIAMAFKDQASWDKRTWKWEELDETANRAATFFLDLLCRSI